MRKENPTSICDAGVLKGFIKRINWEENNKTKRIKWTFFWKTSVFAIPSTIKKTFH